MNLFEQAYRQFRSRLSQAKEFCLTWKKMKNAQRLQAKALKKLKDKPTIRCVFLGLFKAEWKYNEVYQLMERHPRFEPLVLVCPIVNYGRDNMLENLNASYAYFQEKGCRVMKAYDEASDTYVNLRDLQPDILFYTNPYGGLIDDRYYITHFFDVLTVYVPYFICGSLAFKLFYNDPFHNYVWRKYCETDYHKHMAEQHAWNKGINAVTTGYPGIEAFLHLPAKAVSPNKKKVIIWAPHHSIEPLSEHIYSSCFLTYHETMLRLAEKYADEAEFVFKPHPLLKNMLYQKWGKTKTDAYYQQWDEMPNTTLNDGDYTELFIQSDAMIHDSGSFTYEYLYLNKPVMRTLNGTDLTKMYCAFGLACLSQHYPAHNEQDIEQFIQNVINGIDPMKEQRTQFIQETLMPEGSPSQNILDDILNSIDHQILFHREQANNAKTQ